MALLATQDAALEPVRAAMLQRAQERADLMVSQARDAAQALIADARRDANAAVARARADGVAQARPVAAAELNRSRRAARSIALSADRTAHDQVAGQIRAAVLALREGPDYPLLRDRLAGLARHAVGPGAEITEHHEGGVIARSGRVVVDCSLPRLADRTLEALGPRISMLCRS